MQFSGTRATPYPLLPITLALVATKQKVYREVHCVECGLPFMSITDKIATIMDFNTPTDQLQPNVMGIINTSCTRRSCRQVYRLQF